jgi:predicted aspartyl protease
MPIRILIASTFLLLLSVLPASGGSCRPDQHTGFVLETDWYGGIYIPVGIGGQRMKLLVDTGGATSMLTDSTVASLGLTPQPIRTHRVTMYGGLNLTSFVRVGNVQVGAAPSNPSMFYVMPDNRIPYALSGTLAPDFLSRYDVDFDFASARMNLFAAAACPEKAYWTNGPSGHVDLAPNPTRHIIAPVEIDGHTVMALLDTGASRSDLSLETARQLFGSALNQSQLHPATTADAEAGLYTYPFRTISIGGVAVANPDIVLVPDSISRRPPRTPRLILGMGVLRRLHLYVSYSQNRLTLTPAGAH